MPFPLPPAKFSGLLLALLLAAGPLAAQTATRSYDESFPAKDVVSVRQDHGPLTVRPSTDGKIRLVIAIRADAGNQADADAFVGKLQTDVNASGNRLDVNVGFPPVRNWNQNKQETRVTFQDGTKIGNIRNFRLETTLYLPRTQRLHLKTRFEDIRIEDGVPLNDLELDLHNANLRGGNVGGDLEADLRFGKLELGNVGGTVSGDLHNATVTLGDATAIALDARFTGLTCGAVTDLAFEGHNSRLKVTTVTGKLTIDDRFGNYDLGTTGDATIASHNGTFVVGTGGSYRVDSRFGKFRIGTLRDLHLPDSHNSTFKIDALRAVTGEGRFTTLELGRLSEKAELDLTNGKLLVDELAAGFTGVAVEGSFTTVDLDLPAAANYRIDADLRFGDIDVPGGLTVTTDTDKDSERRYVARTGGATDRSPLVKVAGHNLKLRVH